MKLHEVRVYKSEEPLARENQLAWKIASVATDPVEVLPEVTEMVINRIICCTDSCVMREEFYGGHS